MPASHTLGKIWFGIVLNYSFAVFIISCSNKKNSNYIDTLTVNEVISNWKNSIKEKGEPPYLGGMYVENGIVYFCITNDTTIYGMIFLKDVKVPME